MQDFKMLDTKANGMKMKQLLLTYSKVTGC